MKTNKDTKRRPRGKNKTTAEILADAVKSEKLRIELSKLKGIDYINFVTKQLELHKQKGIDLTKKQEKI